MQPEDVGEEIKRLQRCNNDLVSLLALPAVWSGAEPTRIIHTLLDALLRMLHLDLVHIRLSGSGGLGPVEMVRFARAQEQAAQEHDLGEAFKDWLGTTPQSRPRLIHSSARGLDISMVSPGTWVAKRTR